MPGGVERSLRQRTGIDTALLQLCRSAMCRETRLQPGKFQGTIRIFTNDEEFPELLIPVRVDVE